MKRLFWLICFVPCSCWSMDLVNVTGGAPDYVWSSAGGTVNYGGSGHEVTVTVGYLAVSASRSLPQVSSVKVGEGSLAVHNASQPSAVIWTSVVLGPGLHIEVDGVEDCSGDYFVDDGLHNYSAFVDAGGLVHVAETWSWFRVLVYGWVTGLGFAVILYGVVLVRKGLGAVDMRGEL